jgi:beta-alanine--pyruvate transaminase
VVLAPLDARSHFARIGSDFPRAETQVTSALPNDLQAIWLPFTPNRAFKARPRLLAKAQGMYYWDEQGRKVLDAISGLWCVNAGHAPKPVVEAIRAQAANLDYAPSFHFAHPKVIQLAARVSALAPSELTKVFFCNSGSEAADTAMKIARGYFSAIGEVDRVRFVSRVRSYHGVNYGGTSLGGLPNNQKGFGPLVPGTEYRLPLPYDANRDRYTAGEPEGGEAYAGALENICADVGGNSIAAVIVEPMTGSGGVYASPRNYLGRLRTLCDKHGILLIFDEVITGFGRLGYGFAAERYGVTPDMIMFAKGVTNGAVPMGGVIVKEAIYDAFVPKADYAIDLFHGYTYTGHPLATAAGIATLDHYRDEGLFERGRALEPKFRDAVFTLKGARLVTDIRSVGLAAAIDIEPAQGAPGKRGYEALERAFFEEDMVIRISGDTLVLIPALSATESQVARMVEGVARVLKVLA